MFRKGLGDLVQMSKKQYYLVVFLLLFSAFYGYKKHSEVSQQRDYLNPHLMQLMHTIQSEIHTTSIILNTIMTENQIPYAQWKQLKNGFEAIEHSSYEIEKMGRAIYPNHAQGLENATKTTSNLIVNHLIYIEDNFIDTNMDRIDKITIPLETHSMLELIYEAANGWNEVSSQYYVTTDIIKRTYWVDMMKEIQDPSVVFQHQYSSQ